ncbi:MAG: NAD-dependent epimerase/dehydratase family protein [Candidatus Nitrohelix vancouverensis]|uniref:NAD-dependent epimerase/dehydratase family protein n=1 Tax=Candidatus Nitrohelix vancouverensis TaxID=2705534 RepID=A0A7T0C1U6_9BACT|nr:MAG: NAD-dependent epimerase/dehydratase family protein [Candidatus Nitrohelix vancouverensis]
MKILLTGASGGLGSALLSRLLEVPDLKVRALIHKTPVNDTRVETAHGDMEDEASLREATQGIDTVVHLAALTHSPNRSAYFKINEYGTERLIEACRASGVRRFIYISSRAVNPNGGAYSESKSKAEALTMRSGLRWLILRPGEVFGEGDDPVRKLALWVKRSCCVPVIRRPSPRLSPVYIDDVVDAMFEAVLRDDVENLCLTLAGREAMDWESLVDRLSAFFGKRPVKVPVTKTMLRFAASLFTLAGRPGLVPDQIPRLFSEKEEDVALAQEHLNYKPRSLEEGLRILFPA